ncbi:unnamed protein product [Dovyalis caffra]|uniref:Uncharacterized protein n=1 Tax=Dovyalis caffra TaxID=77055 RepID=A0AAV1SI23_9ROSI|nr:unnamed protein product [Dovyalis caffra]
MEDDVLNLSRNGFSQDKIVIGNKELMLRLLDQVVGRGMFAFACVKYVSEWMIVGTTSTSIEYGESEYIDLNNVYNSIWIVTLVEIRTWLKIDLGLLGCWILSEDSYVSGDGSLVENRFGPSRELDSLDRAQG